MGDLTLREEAVLMPDANVSIKSLIHVVRGEQVILDSDLAALYGVETKVLNQAVSRNPKRFPERFCFRLTAEEAEEIRSQIVTLHPELGKQQTWWRYLPRVFTEQGVAMLSAVLRSDTAVETFRAQYGPFELKHTEAFHDRFLILDGTTGYHIGASLKDVGKRCFGINLMQDEAMVTAVLGRLA